MLLKLLKNGLTLFSLFALIFNQSLMMPLVFAQEVTPEPTAEPSESIASPSAEVSVEATPTAVPALEPEPTIQPELSSTPSANLTLTPAGQEEAPATSNASFVTEAPREPVLTPTFTSEVMSKMVWQKNADGSFTTTELVTVNTDYNAPFSSVVTIRFNKLPNSSGAITVKELLANFDTNLGQQVGVAYEVTSDMQDGTFSYDLTLPLPVDSNGNLQGTSVKTDNAQVAFSEDGKTFDEISNEVVNAKNHTVTIQNLDHFTIFVTTATGGESILSDTTGVSYTTLTGPTLAENAGGEINFSGSSGTLVLNSPSGFIFNVATNSVTASVTDVGTCTGSGNKKLKINNGSSQTVTPTTSAVTITVTQASEGNCRGTLAWSGIEIRPTSGTPLASGNITFGGTVTIVGATPSSTNLGSLAEIVGAVSASVSTVSASPTSVLANGSTTSTITITLKDQFDNPVSGKNVSLASSRDTSDTISAASGSSNTNGVVTFTVTSSTIGSSTFTATDTSDSNLVITQTASVSFTNVPPSFDAVANQSVYYKTSVQTTTITNVSPGPSGESSQTVTLSATSSNLSLIPNPTVSGSGSTKTLTYTTDSNTNDSATITVTVYDGQSQNNTYSQTFTITVTADTTEPESAELIMNDNAEYTNTREVTLSISATDSISNVIEMNIYNGSVFDAADWEPYSTSKSWTLPTTEGTKTVSARFRDSVGNENTTSLASDTIILDTAYPEINNVSISSINENNYIKGLVTVSANVTDAAVSSVNFRIYDYDGGEDEATCEETGVIQDANDQALWFCTIDTTSLSEDLFYDLEVTAKDTADNTSYAYYSDNYSTFYVDNSAPSSVTALDSGTKSASANLVFSWPDSQDDTSGVSYYQFWLSTSANESAALILGTQTPWFNIGNETSYTLTTDQADMLMLGTQYFAQVQAVDYADNVADVNVSNWSDGITYAGAPSIVYVDGNYSEESAGDHFYNYDAFSTIQPAIDAVEAGGTINIAEGTIGGGITIDKNLTLVGVGNATILQMDGETVITVNSGTVNISKIKISGAYTALKVNGGNVTISDSEISGNTNGITAGDEVTLVTAIKNYWGSSTGPNHSSNSGGSGDNISDNVSYRSYYTNIDRATLSTSTVAPSNLSSLFTTGSFSVPSSATTTATPSVTTNEDLAINVAVAGGTNSVFLPTGTVITKTDGTNLDASALSAADVSASSLSGLGTGVTVDGALQWGIPNIGLTFSQAITLKIFVGTSFNGQTLNIVKSNSASSGWTSSGIVAPATCVVASGLCTFQATSASYYATTHIVASTSTTSTSGGDGGDGLGCAVHDCSGVKAAAQNIVLGISTPSSSAGFQAGVLGVNSLLGNVGIGSEGQVQSEATASSQPTITASPQAKEANSSFNIKVVLVIIALLLGVFGLFRLLFK